MISTTLKEETKILHAETEKSLNAKRIFSPDFTVQEYVHILNILYMAHIALENKLENISNPNLLKFYKEHYTPHYPLIKQDLENLNAHTIGNNFSYGIKINDLNAIGVLYVLKGSSMGAKFINKQLEETTAQWPQFSGEFYKASSSQSMEQWKTFCTSLESLDLNPEEINQVVDGARFAFKTFIRASKEI